MSNTKGMNLVFLGRLKHLIGLLFVLSLSVFNAFSQKPNYSPLVCTMMNFDFMTKEGEVVTNVMSVKNVNGIAREFYLEIGCPSDWRILTSSKRVYNIEPNDSVFIPVRLLPNLSTMKGSTKYNVTVFVVGTDGKTHAVCSFQVGKPRRVDWEMKVLPRSRIYFLNDQFEADLGINVSNNGEEAQDVNLSWKILGQGLSLHTDSLNKRSFLDLVVQTGMDTVINFKASLLTPQRNVKRVDIENYRPSSMLDARKYTIYFRGAEPKSTKGSNTKSISADVVKLNSAVDFIKLSNNYTVNSYGSSVIPLTWYSNAYNILGYQPIVMNIFRIDMPLANNAFFRANLQHVFTFYTPTNATLRNLNGMMSYNSDKFSVNLGAGVRLMIPLIQSSLTNIGSRSGIAVNYKINRNFQVAASGGVAPGILANQINAYSFSVGTAFTSNDNHIQAALGYGRLNLTQSPLYANDFLSGFQFRFLKRHSASLRLGLNQLNQNPLNPGAGQVINWNWLLGYTGVYWNNRINQSVNAQNRQFVNIQNGQLSTVFFAQSRTAVQITKNFNTNLSIAYRRSSSNFLIAGSNQETNVPVNLSFGWSRFKRVMLIPSIFYVYTKSNLGTLQYRGLNLNKNFTDLDRNLRMSLNLMGGYNKLVDTIQHPELFSMNAFFMTSWRTVSFNVRYAYGPLGQVAVRNFLYNGARYPQYIFSSINYQYAFKNTRFVSEWILNHSWNNQTYGNNINLGPQLFYFTKSKWRFDVRFFYSLNARNNERAVEFYQYQGYSNIPEPEERMTFSNNFNLSFGIKKEFGIPLPKRFRKVKYVDAQFVAFLDFNGNRVMDNDEVPLENIVIKVNGHEVLTDKEGKAKFVNIPCDRYEHKIIPLVELDGWFTYNKDSIDISGELYYVPFTRGVKVAGSVVLDREKFTKDVLANLDLSGIKIFTTDTLGNTQATMTDFRGEFSFYVPYGSYILSMDEEIIGDRFYVAQNHIPMDLYDGMDGFYQSFFIIEKRRTVKKKKFNEKGELIMVEEVEGGTDRNSNNSTINNYGDSTIIHNNNEYNIFNDNRRNGKDSLKRDRYNELDERIDRLDELIRLILDSKGLEKADNKVLKESLRRLKEEEAAKKEKGMEPKPFMETMDPNKTYHLVVGGFVYKENAERYVKTLKGQGFKDAVVIGIFNGHYLVRLFDYPTLEEAIKAQAQYAYIVEGVWVHTWPPK